MALDDKSNEKSRRERRKEARLEKNRKKFDSWIQHQQSQKSTKNSLLSKSKDAQRVHNDKQIQKRKETVLMNSGDEDTSDAPVHSLKQDFTVNSVTESNDHKRKKGPAKKSKTKFQKYLKMEMNGDVISAKEDLRLEKKLGKKLKVKGGKLPGLDDDVSMLLEGIPSTLDSLVEGEKTSKSIQSEASGRKSKKSKLVNEERGDEGKADDNDGGSGLSDASFEKHDNIEDLPVPKKSKMTKRKKTKIEENLETEMQRGVVSAEDEGIPTDLNSLEQKEIKTDEASPKKRENSHSHKTHKRTDSSEQQQEQRQISEYAPPDITEAKESSGAKMARVKAPFVETANGGNTKYVAPHLRSRVGNESEEYAQIRRRLRGLLNRMSESNVESITGEISTIFRSVGRSMGSQIIGEEVLASCSGGPRGNEQYAAVFSAFVAGMACMVGIDFGAKLLASLAKLFEDEYLKEDNLSLRNLTLLLSYLYTFGVCSSELIYDFLMTLSKRLTEVDVSTILTVLQACGMRLRSDDPVEMKNFILNVQNRVNELKASSGEGQSNISSKRMEFMLETICDIKNNKTRPKVDTVQQTRIKKWLQKLRVDDILIRGLKWSKLLDPDKKGQWWLSGDIASTAENIEEVAGTIDREVLEAQKMIQLAAAQRMNTDARRAIFCIIMSGEDYIDAFEKLLRLDLPGKQDREIMRVLVECCLQEKAFNKYYCVLASKLCSHDKNHKFTLQYCLWDHFKELESMQLVRSMHLAKFVAEMIVSFSISLAVLKVVDLSDTAQLTPQRIMHFRMLFEAIFEFPDKIVWNVFTRIAVSPEYESLQNGIELFVSKYVVGSQKSFASKFRILKKALNNVEGILM